MILLLIKVVGQDIWVNAIDVVGSKICDLWNTDISGYAILLNFNFVVGDNYI